jgi:hypothetical protein
MLRKRVALVRVLNIAALVFFAASFPAYLAVYNMGSDVPDPSTGHVYAERLTFLARRPSPPHYVTTGEVAIPFSSFALSLVCFGTATFLSRVKP